MPFVDKSLGLLHSHLIVKLLQLRQFSGDVFVPPVHTSLALAAELSKAIEVLLFKADTIFQNYIALIILVSNGFLTDPALSLISFIVIGTLLDLTPVTRTR